MTIAAGFRCVDGIVIGADTEIGDGNVRRYENKLFNIPVGVPDAGCGIVITGAGDFSLMSHCAQLIRERNLHKLDGSMRGLTGELRAFITSTSYREAMSWDACGTQFIIAIRSIDHQTELFHLHGQAFYPVPRYIAVGSGAETTMFISQWLYDASFPVSHFMPLAIQAFRAAKGQNVGVGGDTNMLRLYNTGKGSEAPDHSIWNDKEFLWGLHDMLGRVVTFMVHDANPADERFDKSLDKLVQKARDVRSSFISDQRSREAFTSMLKRLQPTTDDQLHSQPSPVSLGDSDES